MCANETKQIFENYPVGIVLPANLLTIGIYVLGTMIMSRLGMWAVILYLAVCLFQEIRLMAGSCVHCHYFDKVCFSGRGKVSAWFFKRGNPESFTKETVSWKDLIPDMLIAMIPLGVGIFLLIRDFQWPLLLFVVGLVVLAFPGNGFIRGTQACCHCRQRELGCPAEQLFQGKSV